MKAGLVWRADRLEFKVGVENAVIATVRPYTYRYKASLISASATTSSTLSEAVHLYCERAGVLDGINDTQTVGLRAILYGTVLYNDTALPDTASPYIKLTFKDFKVYCVPMLHDGTWYLTWSSQASEVVVETHNGVVNTIFSWSIQTPTPPLDYFCPASLPLLGLPPELSARTANYFDTAITAPTGGQQVRFDAVGGWRFREAPTTDWTALPVKLDIQPASVSGCCAFSASAPAMSAASTWDARITPIANRDATALTGNTFLEYKYASVRLVPNLRREWRHAMPAVARVLLKSFPMPSATAREHTICVSVNEQSVETCFIDATQDTVIYAASNAKTFVQSTDRVVLTDLRAPHTWTHVREVYPLGETTLYFDKRYTNIVFPLCNNNLHSYYQHSDDTAKYINSLIHPHWSEFYLFDDWSLGVPLTPAAKQHYWIPLRQQWLSHPDLAEESDTAQRTDLLDAPLFASDIVSRWVATRIFNDINMRTHWSGISRFVVDSPARTASRQLTSASEPDWTVTGGTAVFGASDITVTVIGTSATLIFDLAQFSRALYLYPHLADRLSCSVSGPLLVSADLYLINANSEEFLLGAADGTAHAIPTRNETVYAGSWAQDYSANLAGYTETGSDLQASGRSSTLMTTPEGRLLYELLRGGHAQKLKLVATVSAPSVISIQYPMFYHDARTTYSAPETGNVQMVLNSNDRFVRFGVLDMTDFSTRDVDEPFTAYDYLRFRAMLYSASDSVVPSDLFDSGEYQVASDLQTDTRSFVHGLAETSAEPVVIVVNAFRECPPLACHPQREPQGEYWVRDGDWKLQSFSWSSSYRYHVNQIQPLHLYKVDFVGNVEIGRTLWSESEPDFHHWSITRHGIAIDNSESIYDWVGNPISTPRFYLKHDIVGDIARVTPFHGYISVVPSDSQTGTWLSYNISRSGRHARAFIKSGKVWLGLASDVTAQTWSDVASDLTASQPCIRWQKSPDRLRLWITYHISGVVYIDEIREDGTVLGMGFVVGNGQYPTLMTTADGRIFAYWVDGGAIKGRLYDTFGSPLTGVFTAIASVDNDVIAADDYRTSDGRWRMNLVYRVGGEIRVSVSDDGIVFT